MLFDSLNFTKTCPFLCCRLVCYPLLLLRRPGLSVGVIVVMDNGIEIVVVVVVIDIGALMLFEETLA